MALKNLTPFSYLTLVKKTTDPNRFIFRPAFLSSLSEVELKEAKKKLLKAAAWLKSFKLPKKARFTFQEWGQHMGGMEHAPEANDFCGTSGCAIGWFAMKGNFGFKSTWIDGHIQINDIDLTADDSLPLMFESAGVQFGLTKDAAEFLFSPYPNTTLAKADASKEDVATQMEFVATTGIFPTLMMV